MTRVALVLGAGGALGAAWEVGVLCALAGTGLDVAAAELLLGTSAGSVVAALLACGATPDELRRREWGGGLAPARPVRPALRPGSPSLVRRGVLRPRSQRPLVTLVGLAPRGRGSHARLAAALDAELGAGPWPDALRVAALDYATGRRVVFGSAGAPPARVGEAVAASCSLPGWYAPTRLGGVDYVDGGSYSSTSAGLLAGLGLDEALVLAPTCSVSYDNPRGAAERLERRWRRHVTPFTLREVAAVESSGTRVRLYCPGPEDLAAMGANLMNPARRLEVLETALRTTQP